MYPNVPSIVFEPVRSVDRSSGLAMPKSMSLTLEGLPSIRLSRVGPSVGDVAHDPCMRQRRKDVRFSMEALVRGLGDDPEYLHGDGRRRQSIRREEDRAHPPARNQALKAESLAEDVTDPHEARRISGTVALGESDGEAPSTSITGRTNYLDSRLRRYWLVTKRVLVVPRDGHHNKPIAQKSRASPRRTRGSHARIPWPNRVARRPAS